MSETEEIVKNPWYKQWWVGAGLAFVFGFIIGVGATSPSPEPQESSSKAVSDNSDSLRQEIESLKEERDSARTKADEAASKLTSVQAELDTKKAAETQVEAEKAKTTFSDGTYLVGTDMPQGRYKGTAVEESAYWQISSDANGSDIIENDNTEGDFYVQVTAGQFLKINGAEISLVQ